MDDWEESGDEGVEGFGEDELGDGAGDDGGELAIRTPAASDGRVSSPAAGVRFGGRQSGQPPPAETVVVPLLDGRAFEGPFLRYRNGRPLLDVFRLRPGQGSDGRRCQRMAAHSQVRADADVFDLMRATAPDGSPAYPGGTYRAQLKAASTLVLAQGDFVIDGDDEGDEDDGDGGIVLLGRTSARSAEPVPAAASPAAPMVAELLERARDHHQAHVADLKANHAARVEGLTAAHTAEVEALRAGHRTEVEALRATVKELREDLKRAAGDLGQARHDLHSAQLEVHGLKMRLELGAQLGAQAPAGAADIRGLVATIRAQREGLAELREMLTPPESAAEQAPGPPDLDLGRAAALIADIEKKVAPVARAMNLLGDDD